jgi:hypothetical protein
VRKIVNNKIVLISTRQVNVNDFQCTTELGKPVIYLYPPEATEIQVQLQINGEFIVTYPEIDPTTSSRTIIAQPDGTLKNKVD